MYSKKVASVYTAPRPHLKSHIISLIARFRNVFFQETYTCIKLYFSITCNLVYLKLDFKLDLYKNSLIQIYIHFILFFSSTKYMLKAMSYNQMELHTDMRQVREPG